MTVREELLVAFAEETMGPRRADPKESLPQTQDPQYDYIVGILAPKDSQAAVEPDVLEAQAGSRIPEEADKPGYQQWSDEEDDEDESAAAVGPGDVPTALNAKGQPASIGLSVVLRARTGIPRFSVCCTWARYHPEGERWQRHGHSFVQRGVEPVDGTTWNPTTDPSVRILLRTNELRDGAVRVSLFLVNESKVPADKAGKRPPTSALVFQPEIRIATEADTALVPLDPRNVSAEDATLEMLYRARKSFARGHLCSATWGSVDPQRPFRDAPAIPSAPFGWPDGTLLDPETRSVFEPRPAKEPDTEESARTEFLPTYSIESPDIAWNPKYGESPELRAAELSESFDPQALRASLEPMAKGYHAWILEREREAADLRSHAKAASRQLGFLRDAQRRIADGIDVLLKDEDARLAFAFMNKVMDLQAGWGGRTRPDGARGLVWRPFQLGFVLHALPGVVGEGTERETLDLLWFPTGGGKTEAYLGLTVFTLAYRRRKALRIKSLDGGAGVAVVSRYTLRLLTIQQFRRALSAITAADLLRVKQMGPSGIGWRPQTYKPKETFVWGGHRFSIGLWVGGAVTPNQLKGFEFYNEDGEHIVVKGALDVLAGAKEDSEPAQVLNCPACASLLAVPNTGLEKGSRVTLHLLARMPPGTSIAPGAFPTGGRLLLRNVSARAAGGDLQVLSVECEATDVARPADVDQWITAALARATGGKATLECVRASRSGYFFVSPPGTRTPKDFEIVCVNPKCDLTKAHWFDLVPTGIDKGGRTTYGEAPVHPAFEGNAGKMRGMPISGFVVDDQVYARCPSMLIATVDKFARLAYEPKGASLFGNVDHYHEKFGYYRAGAPPEYKTPSAHPAKTGCIAVPRFEPPTLIIQDELHLIEGPLGSMVGLYETALDLLATKTYPDGKRVPPKYVASTATIRAAEPQVRALFNRKVAQFPPSGLAADDSFFSRTEEIHQRDERKSGRLYVGFAAPGKGSQTPVIRAWSALLQRAQELQASGTPDADLDPFWTLVGYFNAIKELARATGLCRIDIPQWVNTLSDRTGNPGRPLESTGQMELSSRAESHILPSLLSKLATSRPEQAVDIVLATSMFGTGVDIDRLGLMFLHSQPKTTSTYIQSTGRIGRRKAGMVITFLGAGRPRDLAHYEFFVGFHRAIHKAVEPVTVAPYSPRARERALGPLSVVLLRNAKDINGVPVPASWITEQRAGKGAYVTAAFDMANRRHEPEVQAIVEALEARARAQPAGRLPEKDIVRQEAGNELDKWQKLAQNSARPDGLLYSESTYARRARRRVVLGDPAHAMQNLDCAFENAPNSLREVEKTVRVDVKNS